MDILSLFGLQGLVWLYRNPYRHRRAYGVWLYYMCTGDQDIDLSKYKKQAHVGGIYKDKNQEQITKIQVSKQADVMVLFLLLEELFPIR